MKRTVVWRPSACDRPAEIWNDGPDRSGVTFAANRINWLLQANPPQAGESRDRDIRILIEEPLAVYYVLSHDDFIVNVFDVWRWGDAT